MDSEEKYWINRGKMGLSGEYRTAKESIGQRGKILDREGGKTIETEKYWTKTGNMGQRQEIWVGEGK